MRRTRRWTLTALCAAVALLGIATLSADVAVTAPAALMTVIAVAAATWVAVPWLGTVAAGARPGLRVALRSHAASPGRGAALVAAIASVVTVAGLVMLGAGGLAERSVANYRATAPDGSAVIDTTTLPRRAPWRKCPGASARPMSLGSTWPCRRTPSGPTPT